MNLGNRMHRQVGLAVALSLAVGSSTVLGGTLKGKATFKGEPERRKVIKMTADPACVAATSGKKVGTEKVIVGKPDDNGVRAIQNVIIYVKSGLSEEAYDAPEGSLTLNQKGCVYSPHVTTIQIGQTLVVQNNDNTLHNIHGLPQKNAEFNFGQPRAGMTKNLTFKKAEIFRVKCDVHPWMGAYVGVFEHPFHAVTDKPGNYEIKNLPAGEYEVVAWHEVYGKFTKKVTVKADGDTELNFELSEKK